MFQILAKSFKDFYLHNPCFNSLDLMKWCNHSPPLKGMEVRRDEVAQEDPGKWKVCTHISPEPILLSTDHWEAFPTTGHLG